MKLMAPSPTAKAVICLPFLISCTFTHFLIAEFGCSEKGAPPGTSKAQWITQTYLTTIPQRYPRVRLVNWFSRDKTAQGETDWRFNSSPDALAAYRAAVTDPRYAGKLRIQDGRVLPP